MNNSSNNEKKARKEAVDAIAKIIAAEEDTIVRSVQEGVFEYISEKSAADCLGLVKLRDNGTVREHLPMQAQRRYAMALISFVRKAEFEGSALDSELTAPVSDLVSNIFSARIEGKADVISQHVIPVLITSDRFLAGLSTSLLSALASPVPKLIQKKVTDLLAAKLSASLAQTIDTSSAAAIKASVAKVAAASIASPIAIKISASLMMSLGAAIKPIILKVLASAAFKAAIAAKIKAIVMGSLLAAFIKFIGVKLGMTAGAAFMWILIPAVIAWLTYEYLKFPKKLAASVSESVAEAITNGFEDTGRSIAEALLENIIVSGAAAVAVHFVTSEGVDELIVSSIQAAQEEMS